MCNDSDCVHVVDGGVVALGVALDRQDDSAVSVDRRLEGRNRPRPPCGKRREL
jgi:hypothetical protein